MNEEAKAWFESRPPLIQSLIREFPPGTVFDVNGTPMHLMSYDEREDGSVGIQVTAVDPREDYEQAVVVRQPLCMEHVRDGSVTVAHLGEL